MMKLIRTAIIIVMTTVSCQMLQAQQQPDSIPRWIQGEFTDDYRITYSINDSLWMQQSAIRYHVLKWNMREQYLIAQNDSLNPSEKGLFTRIDFMQFKGMEPYEWGFCLTVYDALSAESAEKKAVADRGNPRKGCNGYPFSRMKRTGADGKRSLK